MPTLHVVLNKEDLDPSRLHGKVAVVVDVFFATSTIVHALSQGAVEIWPANDATEAVAIAGRLDAPVLAGEYLGQAIAGFHAPTPLALAAVGLQGRRVVYATTNGTVALSAVSNAAHVYAGALLNGQAVATRIAQRHGQRDVLLVCAGSVDRFNLEDFCGAGHIVAHLQGQGDYALTDTARAALLLYSGHGCREILESSRVGRLLQAHGLQDEIDCATRPDALDVVPELRDGCLRCTDP